MSSVGFQAAHGPMLVSLIKGSEQTFKFSSFLIMGKVIKFVWYLISVWPLFPAYPDHIVSLIKYESHKKRILIVLLVPQNTTLCPILVCVSTWVTMFQILVLSKQVHVCTGVAQYLKTFQVIEIEVKEKLFDLKALILN